MDLSFKGQPLTQENSKRMIGLLLNKSKELPLKDAPAELKEQFLVQVFLKRIEAYSLPFQVTDFFFGLSLLTFMTTPGAAMLLLRMCFEYWKKTGKNLLGVDDWAYMFPMGTPTRGELDRMWDSQKTKTGENEVDNPEIWRV